MRSFLVFQLQAHVAACGSPAIGEQRPSWCEPGKGAALGVVAAALGLPPREIADLCDQWGYAVQAANGGRLRDFQTAQTGRTGAPTRREALMTGRQTVLPSAREYLCEAHALIAIWAINEHDAAAAERCGRALERPHYSLSFGRTSCPLSAPPAPQLITATQPAEALAVYAKARAAPPSVRVAPIWADAAPTFKLETSFAEVRERRDVPRSETSRAFRPRLEGRLHRQAAL